ncbi:MAG: dipeptide epimerase [Sulfurimonas sp.]|jgi:L-alanine-DL-glutamate epimerase-like enolase superfamily enzyme
MKIVKIETETKKIPLKTPFITALRRVENVEFVRVTFTCTNGLVGIGEAPATKAITGEGIEEILDSINSAKLFLNNFKPSTALEILHDQRSAKHSIKKIGSSAKAALDMALHSLIAQSQNIPMYHYLGAESAIILQTDITISLNEIQTMVEDAKRAFSDGMRILKIKLGSDITHAIEVTKNIAKELPKARLIIDANQAWNVEDSLRFIDALKDIKLELIEQPVIADNLEGLKTVTSYSNIPILADEAVFTLEDAQKVIETKSADMINIKLMKCGGVTKAIEILQFCRANGVKCMLGSMLEGPFSINIALHLAMAYSDVIKYIDLDSPLLYKELSDELEFVFDGCEISLKLI